MSDLAYTVMCVAVFVGLALLLRGVQWCSDAVCARRTRATDAVRESRESNKPVTDSPQPG